MRRWKSTVTTVILAYIVFNLLGRMMYVFWMNPMIETLVQIRYPGERGRRFTEEEVRALIGRRYYGYARWPYDAAVEGQGEDWILRFEAAPLTLWRRIWMAVAYWEFSPHVPCSYELASDATAVRCRRSDGTIFFMMGEEKEQGSEPGD